MRSFRVHGGADKGEKLSGASRGLLYALLSLWLTADGCLPALCFKLIVHDAKAASRDGKQNEPFGVGSKYTVRSYTYILFPGIERFVSNLQDIYFKTTHRVCYPV